MSKREHSDDQDYDANADLVKRVRKAPNQSHRMGEPFQLNNNLGNNLISLPGNLGQSLGPSSLASLINIANTTSNAQNVQMFSAVQPMSTHDSMNGTSNLHGDDDSKMSDDKIPELAMLEQPELVAKLNSIVYDEDSSKNNGELSKVDLRNNYFFDVMSVIVDYMYEKKQACKQITRLYHICGHYIQNTNKFPDLKMKTISNEYSCANSWTTKVQSVLESTNWDGVTHSVSKDTYDHFPKPFEKYFQPMDVNMTPAGTSTNEPQMQVKPCYVHIYKTFFKIRQRLKGLKEFALSGSSPSLHDKNKMVPKIKKERSGVKLMPTKIVAPNLGPLFDSVAANTFSPFNETQMASFTQTVSEFLNSSLSSVDKDPSKPKHPLTTEQLSSLPPMAWPLPYSVVPEGAQQSAYKPFLTYIPVVFVPVQASAEQEQQLLQSHQQQNQQPERSSQPEPIPNAASSLAALAHTAHSNNPNNNPLNPQSVLPSLPHQQPQFLYPQFPSMQMSLMPNVPLSNLATHTHTTHPQHMLVSSNARSLLGANSILTNAAVNVPSNVQSDDTIPALGQEQSNN